MSSKVIDTALWYKKLIFVTDIRIYQYKLSDKSFCLLLLRIFSVVITILLNIITLCYKIWSLKEDWHKSSTPKRTDKAVIHPLLFMTWIPIILLRGHKHSTSLYLLTSGAPYSDYSELRASSTKKYIVDRYPEWSFVLSSDYLAISARGIRYFSRAEMNE